MKTEMKTQEKRDNIRRTAHRVYEAMNERGIKATHPKLIDFANRKIEVKGKLKSGADASVVVAYKGEYISLNANGRAFTADFDGLTAGDGIATLEDAIKAGRGFSLPEAITQAVKNLIPLNPGGLYIEGDGDIIRCGNCNDEIEALDHDFKRTRREGIFYNSEGQIEFGETEDEHDDNFNGHCCPCCSVDIDTGNIVKKED